MKRLATIAALAALAPTTFAQKQPAPGGGKRIIQVFDVADLIHVPPAEPQRVDGPKPAGPGGVPMLRQIPIVSFLFKDKGKGQPKAPKGAKKDVGFGPKPKLDAHRITLEHLATLLETFIQPKLQDGDEIKTIGKTSIVAMASPDRLAWIERFLRRNRKQLRKPVDVEWRVMTMPNNVFEQHIQPLLDVSDKTLARIADAPRRQSLRGTTKPLVNPMSSPKISTKYALMKATDGLAKLEAKLQKTKGVVSMAIPKVRSGPLMQTAIYSGKAISYVKDFEIETTNNKAIANPVIGVVREGLAADATTAFLTGDEIALRFDFRMLHVHRPIPTFTTTIGVGSKVTLQLPQVTMRRLASQIELASDEVAMFAMDSDRGEKAVILLRAQRAPQDAK